MLETPPSMARRAAFLALLLLASSPLTAMADRPAGDVAEVVESDAVMALPDAPDDYGAERRGDVRWEFPAQAADVAHELQEVYEEHWSRLAEELGGDTEGPLTIRIGRNPEEMSALAPLGAPPPAYASGVAYPARGLILLTLAAPETWQRPDVDSVLVHELSHIALHRAVDGNPIPRWFSEGVAIHQAQEKSLERTRALWGGTVGGRLMPFERLERGFPSNPHAVNLAYAQSADFVRWLRARDSGERKFREVIRRLRDGQSFQTALERTYSITMTELEEQWHASLSERFQALPLLVGSGTLWVLAAFLIVLAYARRKHKDRAKMEEWDEEERTADAAAHALIAARSAAHTTAGPSPTMPEGEHEVLYVMPPEPRTSESGIPTVEHDGRSHTLH
ncbi:MAG: hypothetical protein SangKO_078480 [Sandaracinaceae bacterium]|nr:MAG: hypothetical protein EVA89_23095 [Sandaracinaceae bacterium]HBQ16898.1 hypothetical protein [Myxococcales bacterium]